MLISLIKQIFLCCLPPVVKRDHEESAPNIIERGTLINKATSERQYNDLVATIERRCEEVATKVERGYMDTTNSVKKLCKDIAVEEQMGREVTAKLSTNSRTVIPPTNGVELLDSITQYYRNDVNRCKGCNQIFSSDFKRLDFQSPNNPLLCIGCKSLLGSTSKFDTGNRFNHHNKDGTINISHEANFMQYLHQHKTQNHSVLSTGLLYHLPLSTNYYLKQKSGRNHAKFVYHISYPEENKVSHFTTCLGCRNFIETRRRTLTKATDVAHTKRGCRISGYVASIDELFDLMVKANSTCALSGAKGIWITTPGYPNYSSFMLSLDHRIPMSKGGGSHVGNLQASLQCFNNIKGSNNSKEFQDWLNAFRRQQGC